MFYICIWNIFLLFGCAKTEMVSEDNTVTNEKFVSKAPANVIDMERKKQADAESKIASLKESIAALKK